jgi:hypothetical protein
MARTMAITVFLLTPAAASAGAIAGTSGGGPGKGATETPDCSRSLTARIG